MNIPALARHVLVAMLFAGITAGCGLKGSLELPERSTNIVIRGPGEAPGSEATPGTTPGAATPTPGTPAPKPAPKPAQPREERLPPPPLPDGNPGSSHGG